MSIIDLRLMKNNAVTKFPPKPSRMTAGRRLRSFAVELTAACLRLHGSDGDERPIDISTEDDQPEELLADMM